MRRWLAATLALLAIGAEPAVAEVLVSDPATDPDNNSTQFETALAVNGDTACAGWLDTGPPIGTLAGFASSSDGGDNWVDRGEIPQQGDPAIAVHRATGTFYYAAIGSVGGVGTIAVSRSTDGCQSFASATNAAPQASVLPGPQFNDKPWIAVDNSGGPGDGRVYVCWTRFFDANGDGAEDSSELRVSNSADGGATWPDETVVVGPGRAPFGCNVQVGPSGEVYLTWADRAGDDIWFARSLDGGASFVPVIVSQGITRHPGIDRPANCNPARPTLNGDLLQAHQAWMAVDTSGGPHRGTIYVAWASDPEGPVDNADVLLGHSSDGGQTWSDPILVGAGGGATDQFEPNLAVGGVGQVAIAWYDRRRDPSQNLGIDVFTSYSLDGGSTLTPPQPLTDATFHVPPLLPHYDSIARQCHWGEYMAVAADAARAYYLWTGNARTVTNAQYPNGRPDPDIYFERVGLPPIPSNEFEIGKLRRNTRRGTAKVAVEVPGPGEVEVDGRGARPVSQEADQAETLRLRIKAVGRKRRRLEDRGAVNLRIEIEFTPAFGDPNTEEERVRLRLR